jgi:Ca2+-binding RTX toxin-like protein
MRRFRRSVLAFALLLTALVTPGVAGAQAEVSPACTFVDNYRYPPNLFTTLEIRGDFLAGETIRVTVDEPSLNNPQTVIFGIDGGVVSSGPLPSSLSYTIPADGTYTFSISVDENTAATFDLECTNEPPPPTTPTCNGQEATIYVKDGIIVGGPNNGAAYTGTLVGTSGNDVMVGTEGLDEIEGAAGNDTICAFGGADTIAGAAGNDTMLGGAGADNLNGAGGTDTTPDFNAAEDDKRTNVP